MRNKKDKENLLDILAGLTLEQRKKLKLNKKQILKFKTHKNLIDYFTGLPDKILVNGSVMYQFSNGEIKRRSRSFSLPVDVANNKVLYELIMNNYFHKYEPNDDDHGYGGILDIFPPTFPRTRGVNVEDILMRFSEKNDCALKVLYNGIKNIDGFKRYTLEKLKIECKSYGININNGTSFNDIKTFIEKGEHKINVYLFDPDGKLVNSVRHKSRNAIPQVLMTINNNHTYSITDEKIRHRVIQGMCIDISDENPVTKFRFDPLFNYPVFDWDSFSYMALERDFEDHKVIIVETKETFCKMVNFLLKIDRNQLMYIDVNRECVLFDNVLIFLSNGYTDRRGTCIELNKKYDCLNFSFINQTYASIGNEIYKIENGDILKSSYNTNTRDLIDQYQIEPVHIGGLKSNKKWKYKIGGDCPKSYSNAIIKYFKNKKIGVCSMFNNYIEDVRILDSVTDDRYYLIDGITLKGMKLHKIGWVPYFYVDELIRRGFKVSSYGYLKYIKYFDGNDIVNFVERVYDAVEIVSDAKKIVNSFIGNLNSKFIHENRGFITIDPDMVMYAIEEGFEIEHDTDDETTVYICKSKNKTRKYSDNSLIYSSVISCGILNLLDLVDHLDENVGEYFITGINTDAVYYLCDDQSYTSKNNGYFCDKNYKIDSSEYHEKRYVEFIEDNYHYEKKVWTLNGGGSYIHNQGGGYGKTYTAIMNNKYKKILCLAFENNAVDTLRNECIKQSATNYECMTIHYAFGLDVDGNKIPAISTAKFDEFDCIIIDEIFRIDPFLMTKIFNRFIKFNGNLILMGHSSQNTNIGNEKYDYSKCDAIGELVGFNYFKFTDEEMIEKIKLGKCRYDMETYLMLRHLEEFKNLDGYTFKPIDKKLPVNIVWTNKMKDTINGYFSKKLSVGDKFILKSHYTEFKMFKGYMGVVENFDNKLVNGMFNLLDCYLNYATTCHGFQGKKINEKYNIHQVGIMSFELIYTAISRCTNKNLIHMNLPNGITFRSEYDDVRLIKINSKRDDDEILYKITDDNSKVYAGRSKREEEVRFKEHTSNTECTVNKNMTNPVIERIGRVLCNSKLTGDLEWDYITFYKKTCRVRCINLINFDKDEITEIPKIKEQKIKVMGWEFIGSKGKIYEYTDKNMFIIKRKCTDTDKWVNKQFNYKKKGRSVVLESVKNWCDETEIEIENWGK